VVLGEDGEICWNDRVRNEEVLERGGEERNIIHTANRREGNWIGHILCGNCLLQHLIVGKDRSEGKTRKKT
jgi:hypothetical protein